MFLVFLLLIHQEEIKHFKNQAFGRLGQVTLTFTPHKKNLSNSSTLSVSLKWGEVTPELSHLHFLPPLHSEQQFLQLQARCKKRPFVEDVVFPLCLVFPAAVLINQR